MSTLFYKKLKSRNAKRFTIEEFEDSPDSSASSSSEDMDDEPSPGTHDFEYYHIQKLMKFMKVGNDTATSVALCCLLNHDLTVKMNQLAIRDAEGLELLANLLETNSPRCRQGALMALSKVSQNKKMGNNITALGCVNLLVKNLLHPDVELRKLTAETIHHLAKRRKAREEVCKCGGIIPLIDLLDVNENCLKTPREKMSPGEENHLSIVISAIRALWSVSKSKRNRDEMMKFGIIPLLAKLLRSIHLNVVIPAMATASIYADNSTFQLALQTEYVIKDVVRNLKAQELELKQYCATILFKCAENPTVSCQIREAGGLDPLVEIIRDIEMKLHTPLLIAVIGAIWKAAMHEENLFRLEQLKTVEILVDLVEHPEENEDVLSHTVGALNEFLKFKRNYEIIRRAGGISNLVNLLNYTYPPLLKNISLAIGRCAEDEDCIKIIEHLDGVRLLWSLLKNPNPKIQENAALSLVPCIKNATDSGEMARSFVSGLQLVVKLLRSHDNNVLASACATIVQIAQDKENLAIISDYGVVPMLSSLVGTKDVILRKHLAYAISQCCEWHTNCKIFGRLGVITSIAEYIASNDKEVQKSAAIALYHLSKNPYNCITMHESGVVPYLLKMINTDDQMQSMQEASANCLGNMRRLALKAENYHLKTGYKIFEDDSN